MRIARIRPRDGRQPDRGIQGGTTDRTDVGKAPAEGSRARFADPAESWLETEDAAMRGGHPDGSPAVRTDRQGHETAGHRAGRAPRGAPGIVIEVVATNALSDLRRREADIAIRNTEPTDPEMIARRLSDQQGGLFATPEFIKKYGPFGSLSDLESVPFVGFADVSGLLEALTKRHRSLVQHIDSLIQDRGEDMVLYDLS